MARLLIRTEGLAQQTLELRLGVNHIGRDPDSDFPILHPTLSSRHCELIVSADGVMLRDCGSTNGSFINGDAVTEAWLMAGQEVRLGDVELFVESTEVNVAIPQFDRALPPKKIIALEDGLLACPRHEETHATFKCTECHEVMCSGCVRRMRRQGGATLFLCVLCSHKCEPIQLPKVKKKRSFFGFLQDTVKLKFHHPTNSGKSPK